MRYERASVALFARELGILPETVRAAANRVGLEWLPGGDEFMVPTEGAQYQRFIQWLAVLPQNRAEQLRADMGILPRRIMPLE